MKQNKDWPYYDTHKIVDLTCPKCKNRMAFIINEKAEAKYICVCGTWWEKIEFYPTDPRQGRKLWIYKPDESK